ncbi:MAG TPA: hypothetical protein PLQ97_04835 [Myxococcota bacterium]|nr:hypothetical protein [Myxococcota bacterium]HQK51051.1 hypothetical protein [Myxococcota bacterium]
MPRISSGLCLILALAPVLACAPDRNSGGDAERHLAKLTPLGQPVPDSLDRKEGDTTDWKLLDIQDTGYLNVEVVLDNPEAEVMVEAFDRYGQRIGRTVHRKDDGPVVKLSAEVVIGKGFLRITHLGGPKTGYTLKAFVR